MRIRFLLLVTFLVLCHSVAAQTTEFTYQGRLLFSGVPASGNYDFEFSLFDDVAAGTQQGATLTLTAVNVNNGVFSVRLDFGDQFPGAARFLEIGVRSSGDPNFTLLSPRQAITSAPYAIKSLNADNAATATNAAQLGGVAAGQFVSTTDARLTDSRSPSPGSANYIQNGTIQQPASFNISGTGSIGTKLIATFINSTSIGINNDTPAASLHIKVNNGNLLAGNAGCNGGFTGIGFAPSFTACTNYSLLGNGLDTMVNRPAGGNIFFREANTNQMTIVPGGNVGIGISAPEQRLQVDGNEVLSTGTQSGFKFRDRGSVSPNDDWVWYSSGNVARLFHAGVGDVLTMQTNGTLSLPGSGTFSGNILNASTQYNIGGQRVLSATGATNTFVGINAGAVNLANDNSFFGNGAGKANTSGSVNSFFGTSAGVANTTGSKNSFFGFAAGAANTTGADNVFVGFFSGSRNTTGIRNSFFGSLSGQNTTTASDDSFFGVAAGSQNTTGFENTFMGASAGAFNTTGNGNSFLGAFAGNRNTTGRFNTFIGDDAGQFNTTALHNTFVGFGSGNANTDGAQNSFFGSLSGVVNTTGGDNSFFGFTSGTNNTTGFKNAFFGSQAGLVNTTGSFNSFFGQQSGFRNTTGEGNSFFGQGTGTSNSTGSSNSFFGANAGTFNTTASDNSFFGNAAGFENTGSNNTFVGSNAGFENTTAGNNTFVGATTGHENTTGTGNTLAGTQAGMNNTTGSSNSFFGFNSGLGNTTAKGNSFFGTSSGQANTIGFNNSFFGIESGLANTTANGNSFFGAETGIRTTTGGGNTFLGFEAGLNNSTAGGNVFVGEFAGITNVTGLNNTTIGMFADVGAPDLSQATAIGARASVTQSNSLVLGAINGVNGATADINVGIGTTAPQQKLHVDGNEVLSTGFQSGFKFRNRGSASASDDWVWYSAGNVARFFRAGVGDLLTIQTTGVVGLTGLASAGSTTLCRNAVNQIANCSSSIRYKSNISAFRSGLDLVKRLHPVTFRWKDSGLPDLGLVAEDVNKVEPLLTTTNALGEVEGVKYDRLGVVLLNSINEQQTQIQSQQEEIKQQQQTILRQQRELEQQKKELDSLKTLVCSQNRQAAACRKN